MEYANFGDYIRQKRIDKKISIREFANMLQCSPSYVSAVEQNHRNPYDKERLKTISNIFLLSKEEENLMLTLAGKSKVVKSADTVSVDLSGYIRDNDHVSAALRTARDLNASKKDWEQFVEELKRRRGNDKSSV